MKEKYFLGANGPLGFYGLYDHFTDPMTDRALFIIKGGSGCGKSTFMKHISNAMTTKGHDVEEIYCSADPSSLDGLYIPSCKTAYVDGTAPHVLEAKFAGVFEQYINLGENYDIGELVKDKTRIIHQIQHGKSHYKRAYDYLAAADKVWHEIVEELCDPPLIEKIKKRSRGMIGREIASSTQDGTGKIKKRFLTSFTHRGYSDFFAEIAAKSKRIYHLDNQFGFAHILLEEIQFAAVDAGFDVTSCPSPLGPSQLDHLIIPELGLAFLSSDDGWQYQGRYDRHIRLDAMVDAEKLKKAKQRIKFSKKVRLMLMEEAIKALGDAKNEHEILEQLYNPHVDFAGVLDMAEEQVQMLLKKE